ncbi:chorismate mutase [Batrachochytrium salamandrivorans]|nr:chorismate mutase [Batrachochytrium salamandrivorans]
MSTTTSTTSLPEPKRARSESSEFSLSSIRDALIRQEDTIIFAMIERGQFANNAQLYKSGALGHGDAIYPNDSFFEHFLYKTETLHSSLGRYREGDLEHAFFENRTLPKAYISSSPVEVWGKPLKTNQINFNPEILSRYPQEIASMLACGEEDLHFGSTSLCDVALLQALSYRIHYGKLVAESKFRSEKHALFVELITNKDAEGIMRELTDVKVEDKVIDRVTRKAARYGSEENQEAFKVKPEVVGQIFRNFLIPLTKEVQVAYLLERLN